MAGTSLVICFRHGINTPVRVSTSAWLSMGWGQTKVWDQRKEGKDPKWCQLRVTASHPWPHPPWDKQQGFQREHVEGGVGDVVAVFNQSSDSC